MRARIQWIVLALVAALAICVAMSLRIFRVHNVEVDGLTQRTPDDVVALMDIDDEQSLFQLNYRAIRKTLESSPYFDEVRLRVRLPDTLLVSLKEHGRRAVVLTGGQCVSMDEQGYVVQIDNSVTALDVPVVTGLAVTKISLGEKLACDEAQLAATQAVLTALCEQGADTLISEIHVAQPSDLTLVTKEGFFVTLGNFEHMTDKVRWLRATLPLLRQEGRSGGSINLSTGVNATYRPASGEDA